MRWASTILGMATLLAAGCFNPEIDSGLACPDQACPPDETCGADGFCHPDDGGDEQSFAIGWRLLVGDWDETQCGPNQLDAVTIRTYETTSGALSEDWVSCADGYGETGSLPVGEYEVWLEIWDVNENLRIASPIVTHMLPSGELVDLGRQDVFVDKGFFYAGWQVLNAMNDQIPCGDVGATEVWFDVEGTVERFPCGDGYAETGLYPLGQYSVTVSLHDGSGGEIGAPQVVAGALDYGAAGVDLGNFELRY